MSQSPRPGIAMRVLWVCALLSVQTMARAETPPDLKQDFDRVVKPFVATYCTSCHGKEKPKAKFDLSPYTSLESVTGDLGHWELVLTRLRDGDMPPDEAKKLPNRIELQQMIDWIERVRRAEALRTAGDPGPVLTRRLSNVEYNYTIHDLTGVDIRPTQDFPVDPANTAGFDNSGESLAMSPALLNKYLAAARHVADHLVLLPDGLAFAPHPVVVYSDRDKYCVHRIVDFYKQQPIDYADYFFAAWQYHHRSKPGMREASLADIAKHARISSKYLQTIWAVLTDRTENAGPVATLREQWNQLPIPDERAQAQSKEARAACEKLRDWVRTTRKDYYLPIGNYSIRPLHPSNQALILAKDREIAGNRRRGKLPEPDGKPQTELLRQSIARFCFVFPDTFFVPERGRMFEKEGLDRALDPSKRSTGRLLSAGFHLMLGYFRDDAPLYDLILDSEQQQTLDRMWRDLDFVTQAAVRQFSDFIYFERAEQPAFLKAKEFDFAREDTDITSQAKIERLAKLYLAKSKEVGVEEPVLKVLNSFFQETAANIQRLEKARLKAESSHLPALLAFAARAWQRPLTKADRDELLGFYGTAREKLGLSHEDALRDTLVSVLMSPRFCYRVTVAKPGREPQPVSDYELASRLSYFLWSSIPDQELLERARVGDLHQPAVLMAQTRRMLKHPRASRLATEFGGHWLEFRRFQTHNGVNRERFPMFSDDLRQAMYEEPVHFITDIVQRDGSVLEFLSARHTFVNKVLADHYGIPFPASSPIDWVRVNDADRHGRGGILPMSIFLTKNAPGLRTSPVKRGYWVVRRLLGEYIPAPPPEVPELPKDESKLGERSVRDVLASHRAIASCARCHNRFDSVGLAFEAYGPIGERRQEDLGGRPVDNKAIFPDGSEGVGLEGLKSYLLKSRQNDFVDNLTRKLFAYGLGRSLLLSDEPTVETIKQRLAGNEYRFGAMIDAIVTSPQFLRARGRDFEK